VIYDLRLAGQRNLLQRCKRKILTAAELKFYFAKIAIKSRISAFISEPGIRDWELITTKRALFNRDN